MGKYSKYGESGEYVDRIGFDDLVKLYVNHRPVFAVGPEQIRQAFDALKRYEPGPIPREQLLGLLSGHGEKMSSEELEKCLEALVGDPAIRSVLDDEVDALDFARNILGLADGEETEAEARDAIVEAPGDALEAGSWAGAAGLSPGATAAP